MFNRLAAFFRWLFRLGPRRDIYTYWDGSRQRRADPLVLYRKLVAHPEVDLDADFQAIQIPHKLSKKASAKMMEEAHRDAWEATDRVQKLAREVFGVKTLEEGGLTAYEVDDLLADFLYYMDRIKKKRSQSLPSSPSSDPTSSTGSTGKRSVVLSGTPSESSTDEPTPSSSPSKPPPEE